MIWFQSELIPDESLRISVLDRNFEHGLGLFETLRTWNGHPTLLPRHLERMERSARELGLPLDPARLPDPTAVLALIGANRRAGGGPDDVRIRIVCSGGTTSSGDRVPHSSIWMLAGMPVPAGAMRPAVIDETMLVTADDPLARHKTLNYWRKRIAHERASAAGADEVLCVTPDGLVCEGTRTNVFLLRNGRLMTPAAGGPLLPGVMRRVVLDYAPRIGLEVDEVPVPIDVLAAADEAFLTNSVHGMLPVSRLLGKLLPAPGPVTRRLSRGILARLKSGEIPS
jgi:branched-subunit amino acid aminotransferase/4-amino-4-deoxychorismate lyase